MQASDGTEVMVRTRREGEHAVIEVIDHGCGSAPEIRGKIFDPFFTTKPAGKGTGLGLYITFAVVSAPGGEIDVESEPGRGSTFRVRLPLNRPDGRGVSSP